MAVEAEVIRWARAFADVIHGVAAKRGWLPQSYRIFTSVNPDWHTLHMMIINYQETFSDKDQQDIYDDVFDGIESQLGPVPGPFNHFSLIIRGREYRGDLDSMPLGPHDELIDPEALDPSLAGTPPAGTPSK